MPGSQAAAANPTSSRRPDASAVAPETGVVLRQARERGEGWYAAVARAAESWDTVQSKKPKTAPTATVTTATAVAGVMGQPEGKKSDKDQQKHKRQTKEKDKEGEKGTESGKRKVIEDADLEKKRREEEQKEQERQRLEFEARAEERRLRADDERRRAEEDRRRSEQLKLQRQKRLKGAFAVEGDDADEDQDREAELVRRASERKRSQLVEVPLGAAAVGSSTMLGAGTAFGGSAASPSSGNSSLVPKTVRGVPVDPDLSEKLRFEPGLNPAEAFMRLQERKRKGRRAEFGGPPRGCSPWRDGKRGVTFEKDNEAQRQEETT